jgi:hypothetical protein
MPLSDPRPYPRLTTEQMDRLLPQVALLLQLNPRTPAPAPSAATTPNAPETP